MYCSFLFLLNYASIFRYVLTYLCSSCSLMVLIVFINSAFFLHVETWLSASWFIPQFLTHTSYHWLNHCCFKNTVLTISRYFYPFTTFFCWFFETARDELNHSLKLVHCSLVPAVCTLQFSIVVPKICCQYGWKISEGWGCAASWSPVNMRMLLQIAYCLMW